MLEPHSRHAHRLAAAALLTIAAGHACAAEVCFYENYNYQGASWCSTSDASDVQAPVLAKVSSVKFPAGTQVVLYDHLAQAGRSVTVPRATANLDALGFNNLTASFRQTGQTPQVCFYEDYNYQGASWCSTQAQGNVQAPVLGKVSSVSMPASSQVVLYDQDAYAGAQLALSGDTANLAARSFNNRARSYRWSATPATTPSTRVLFVGNSFFHGHFEPTLHYNKQNVDDLNGSGYGGVPGIFKQLTAEAGLNYAVSIEAVSSQNLKYHYENKLALIGKQPWDVVVMQDQSTLNGTVPGTPTQLLKYSKLLEQYVHGSGGNAQGSAQTKVWLMATWARADQLYNTPSGPWYGQPAEVMTADIKAAYARAAAEDAAIAGVIPVGDAFLAAIQAGLADRNPYDGIDPGKVSVWNVDNFHASAWGSYLEALVLFGRLTGGDPRTLGANSQAARDLGLTPTQAIDAQHIAWQTLLYGLN